MQHNSFTQKAICVLLVWAIFITGCAGSAPNPVDRYMPGDEKKSCRALFAEIKDLDNNIAVKNNKIKERDTWNVVFFITGFLVIVPWFLIDCKNSYKPFHNLKSYLF